MKNEALLADVQQLIVAAVPPSGGDNGQSDLWDVYVINLSDQAMDNVVITSQGYGLVDGNGMSTNVLRHFQESLGASSAVKVEPIQSSLFGLRNEYLVSFNTGEESQERGFVFRPNTIREEALERVPVIDKPGVILR